MTTHQVDNDATELYRKFFAARASEGGWKKEKERLKAEIEERYGSHLAEHDTALTDPDGKLVAKVRHVLTRKFNSKRLQAEKPATFAEYQDSATQVRIEEPSE